MLSDTYAVILVVGLRSNPKATEAVLPLLAREGELAQYRKYHRFYTSSPCSVAS